MLNKQQQKESLIVSEQRLQQQQMRLPVPQQQQPNIPESVNYLNREVTTEIYQSSLSFKI